MTKLIVAFRKFANAPHSLKMMNENSTEAPSIVRPDVCVVYALCNVCSVFQPSVICAGQVFFCKIGCSRQMYYLETGRKKMLVCDLRCS